MLECSISIRIPLFWPHAGGRWPQTSKLATILDLETGLSQEGLAKTTLGPNDQEMGGGLKLRLSRCFGVVDPIHSEWKKSLQPRLSKHHGLMDVQDGQPKHVLHSCKTLPLWNSHYMADPLSVKASVFLVLQWASIILIISQSAGSTVWIGGNLHHELPWIKWSQAHVCFISLCAAGAATASNSKFGTSPFLFVECIVNWHEVAWSLASLSSHVQQDWGIDHSLSIPRWLCS